MVPERIEQPSEANWLAYQQDFCACECVRSPRPLEQKTAYGVCPRAVSDAYQRRLMECHARRPPEFPRAALFRSDAWLSCAGPGELAPEVGILNAFNLIQGRLVPPVATAAQL